MSERTLFISDERLALTKRMRECSPTLAAYIGEFGEESIVFDEEGTGFTVKLTDANGQVDMRKVRLAKEMEKERQRTRNKLANLRDEMPDLPDMENVQRFLNMIDPKGKRSHEYAGMVWDKSNGLWRAR